MQQLLRQFDTVLTSKLSHDTLPLNIGSKLWYLTSKEEHLSIFAYFRALLRCRIVSLSQRNKIVACKVIYQIRI